MKYPTRQGIPSEVLRQRPDRLKRPFEFDWSFDGSRDRRLLLQPNETRDFLGPRLSMLYIPDRIAKHAGSRMCRLANGFACIQINEVAFAAGGGGGPTVSFHFDLLMSFSGCTVPLNVFNNPSGFSRTQTIIASGAGNEAGLYPFGLVETYSNLSDKIQPIIQVTNGSTSAVQVTAKVTGWVVGGDYQSEL